VGVSGCHNVPLEGVGTCDTPPWRAGEEAAPSDVGAPHVIPLTTLAQRLEPLLARRLEQLTCTVEQGDASAWPLVESTIMAMNPSIDPAVITDALAADEQAARAEWFAEFRSDLESFVALEALVAITTPGRLELAPQPGLRYVAFKDPAGGSGQDADAVAIAHAEMRDGRVVGVLDCVRFTRPPFSPSAVTAEHAALLRSYGIREVTGDRFAGSWPAEEFTKHGITYLPSERSKGEIYRDTLPLINSAALEWLDLPTLRAEALGLERRTAWGGRDSIDHAPHGHDDVVNVVCGACLLAVTGRTHTVTPAAAMAWADMMEGLTTASQWREREQ
jgi:hypothetical protein